jgi:hypothetical protein
VLTLVLGEVLSLPTTQEVPSSSGFGAHSLGRGQLFPEKLWPEGPTQDILGHACPDMSESLATRARARVRQVRHSVGFKVEGDTKMSVMKITFIY